MTAPGVLLGTVLYMAPEQVRGLPVDARADVWAFGCVLYEMVTGQSPFIGKTTADILAAVLDREPVAPVSLRTDVPTGLVAIIARALAKDPAERFQTMADVGDALRAVGRGLDAQIVSGGHPEVETAAVDAPTAAASLPGATTDGESGAIQTRHGDGVGDRGDRHRAHSLGPQRYRCRSAACAACHAHRRAARADVARVAYRAEDARRQAVPE